MISLVKEFEGVYTTKNKRYQIVNEQEMTLGIDEACWAIYDLKKPRVVKNLIRAIPLAEFPSLEDARDWISQEALELNLI